MRSFVILSLFCLIYVRADILVSCSSGCTNNLYYDVQPEGASSSSPNAGITVQRGSNVTFVITTSGHPFAIHFSPGQTSSAYRYTRGVTNNGITVGQLSWQVPSDAPNVLFYQSEAAWAMFGRIEVQGGSSASQGTDSPSLSTTATPTSQAPLSGIWRPKCDDFSTEGTQAPSGATTSFSFPITATTVRKRETAAPAANPEIIGGAPPTEAPLKTSGGGTSTGTPGPESGAGSSYRCATTTRAEQLMQLALFNFAREGIAPSEVCSSPGVPQSAFGPGIFMPPTSARYFSTVSACMFNAFAVYDREANPISATNPPSKRTSLIFRTKANKEIAITYAAYTAIVYLLPKRADDIAQSLFEAYGLDVNNPSTQAGLDGINACKDYINTQLKNDGTNQEFCYADTTGWVRTDAPVQLDSYATVNASFNNRKDFYKWSDVKKTGFVGNRPYFCPHAKKWRYILFNDPALQTQFMPKSNPLPSAQQLYDEHVELIEIQRDLDNPIDKGRRKIQAHYFADGPRTTLPPGHIMDVLSPMVARPKRYSLEQAIIMYTLAGVSLYESGTACWQLKREYQSIRPGEFIPLFFKDKPLTRQYRGAYCPFTDIIGWQWTPYQLNTLNTPPFPEYPSGHSSFTSSVMTAMALYTGTDVLAKPLSIKYKAGGLGSQYGPEHQCFKNGTSLDGSGCQYTTCPFDPSYNSENNFSPSQDGDFGPFTTYSGFALSSGYSRMYGGIHPKSGNLGGLTLGAKIGELSYQILCANYIGRQNCLHGRDNVASGITYSAVLFVLSILVSVFLW